MRVKPLRQVDAGRLRLEERALRFILIATVCLLLAACGSTPQRPVATAPAPGPDTQAPAITVKPQVPPSSGVVRPGGYYKDDGPGDDPPPNLADVPDAQPRTEPLHRFANEPYSALGQNYTPARELAPFRQLGLASWYGRMFHGKKTSSGEPYDMYAMTGAHPTLPIPSYARVTNVNNGKSVVVRINDRGPFHPGRVIDLSYAAATRLGYASTGHTLVRVESIMPDDAEILAAAGKPAAAAGGKAAPPAGASSPVRIAPVVPAAGRMPAEDPIAALERPAEAPAPAVAPSAGESRGIFVQLGAFRTSDKAENLRDKVRREIAGLAERLLIEARDGMFRLHVGPYGSIDDARAIAARVGEALGLKPLLVRRGY